MIMTNVEHFINDVTSEAFIVAIENKSGVISLRQLDEIVIEHPYYVEVESMHDIQEAVVQIETILKENNRIVVAPTGNQQLF